MFDEIRELPKMLTLYLKIRQYPILADTIHKRMRQELFQRGVITPERFESDARERAIATQEMEGLNNPFVQELPEVWLERLRRVRDHLTEFYFAYNIPIEVFDDIVARLLEERIGHKPEVSLAYNPEMAPVDVLVRDGLAIESLPPSERKPLAHHLQEIIVVIIKTIISDQLEFVGVAKEWLTVTDLDQIRRRRIGKGKIGGKAAGIVLAWKILQQDKTLAPHIRTPESYFIGTDVFTSFKTDNNLVHVMNQKYKPAEQIRAEYPGIKQAFLASRLPDSIYAGLRDLLDTIGDTPLVVRSSSLLEDSFGTSFAGKYESFFCPNQASLDENLERLAQAISQVYASVYSPDALLYRRRMGLLDYDERMAILIQVVEGEQYGNYHFPPVAGVAFSRNPFRWTPRIRPEDGLVRMVCGLGTRAVDRVGDDYPRMVALSHPSLRTEVDAKSIRRYSQHMIDLLNLKTNRFETRSIYEVLGSQLIWLRLLASQDKDGYLQHLFLMDPNMAPTSLVLTFDQLLERTEFVARMKRMLKRLTKHYQQPVDVEFTVQLDMESKPPELSICLVQCRPQSYRAAQAAVKLPADVPAADKVFASRGIGPEGCVEMINFVVYVPPERYAALQSPSDKIAVARVIGRVNQALDGERFILIGPNRWGSNNPDLGVKVTYADIHNTKMLVELAYSAGRGAPEPSYGTHFFQDLIESNIYPVAIYPDREGGFFREALILNAPNLLANLSPEDARYADYVHVVNLPAATGGRTLRVVMDADAEELVGYLVDRRRDEEL